MNFLGQEFRMWEHYLHTHIHRQTDRQSNQQHYHVTCH